MSWAKGSLKLASLAGKGCDGCDWDKLLAQMSIEDMTALMTLGCLSRRPPSK